MNTKYFGDKSEEYFVASGTKTMPSKEVDIATQVDQFNKTINDYSAKRQIRTKIIKKRYALKQD